MRSGHQTKTGAMLETFGNTFSGFALSYLTWVFVVAPLWKLDVTPGDNFWITCIFTVLSLVRSYTWRRVMTRVHQPAKELRNA